MFRWHYVNILSVLIQTAKNNAPALKNNSFFFFFLPRNQTFWISYISVIDSNALMYNYTKKIFIARLTKKKKKKLVQNSLKEYLFLLIKDFFFFFFKALKHFSIALTDRTEQHRTDRFQFKFVLVLSLTLSR